MMVKLGEDGGGISRCGSLPLRAGPFSLRFDHGDLRYIKLGSKEILQRIYFAIRDPFWRTVPACLDNIRMEADTDSFAIEYEAEDRMNGIDFRRLVKLTGRSDGRIDFAVTGRALRPFRLNRIGICVLHASDVWRGCRCTIEHCDGRAEETSFPDLISPHQPFLDIRAIRHDVGSGASVEVHFAGDVFETEDQRNWSDGSFKTYCPPISLPFPRDILEGEEVHQSVTICCRGETPVPEVAAGILEIGLGDGKGSPLPRIGLGVASHKRSLQESYMERLRALNISHLRIDLWLSEPGWPEELQRASREAYGLNVSLELAVHLSGAAEPELSRLVEAMRELRPPVCRLLVFRIGKKTTPENWLRTARRVLSGYNDRIPIGGGAYNYFADLNRNRPKTGAADWICFSLNPQVHAFDNDSLMETLAGQADMVETAASFSSGLPIAVTPVTLKPRFNPNMAVQDASTDGVLPPEVDPRQSSLFAAAWTAGSIRRMTASGAASLTYFETTGWLGLMDAEPPLPASFSSPRGTVYPVYFVFAWLGEFSEGFSMPVQSSYSKTVDALGLCSGARRRMLVFNLLGGECRVRIHALPMIVRLKCLNEETMGRAIAEPADFVMGQGRVIKDCPGWLDLTLSAYEIVCLDWEV